MSSATNEVKYVKEDAKRTDRTYLARCICRL
jgi:hypothetical protein